MLLPSHFTMVGFDFDVQSQPALAKEVVGLTSICNTEELSPTQIVCLQRDASGAEIRVGLLRGANGQASLATLNPAFQGEGRVVVKVSDDVSDPESKPFEITISAQFDGEKTPLVFELADPKQANSFASGNRVTLDIAAFTFEPKVFKDAAAYLQAQNKSGQKAIFASNYFIPSGMFFEHVGGAMPDDSKKPTAYADFAGTVMKSDLRTNVAGGGKFWWALVKTYDDATIDVVMDPSTVTLEPKPGTVVTGRFWLSARAVSAQ